MSPKIKKRGLSNIVLTKSRDLLKRRFPQILGVYLACSWGILEFVDWIVNRYVLSPYLVDFSLVILLSMIPTVALLAYFHGRPGKKWPKLEKIGIPTNFIASFALLFFIFYGKDLGSATTTVSLVNEEGEQIERVIPKSEFRKSIFVFFFDNESSDSTLNWLQYGITDLLGWDLSQDLYLDIWMHRLFYFKAKESGFTDGIRLPLTLKRKMVKHFHKNYFLSGSFTKQKDNFLVKTSLYRTEQCKLVKERKFEGVNIFSLIDDISVQLKHDLDIPTHYIENVEDFPVSELLTNSLHALKLYSLGMNAYWFENDDETAIKYLEQSIRHDSTFIGAYWDLTEFYRMSGQWEKEKGIILTTMKYIYKFPEKHQFGVKAGYYRFVKDEPDKVFAVFKMWVELCPNDLDAHNVLATQYEDRNQLDDAVLEYKRILEFAPWQHTILWSIGNVYTEKGEFEQALKYYKRYADKCPDDSRSFRKIGALYETFGDYKQAKQYYDKALLIEPEYVNALVSLADIDAKLGNFGKAFQQYQDALRISKSIVYDHLRRFYELRGKIGKALEYSRLALAEKEKLYPRMWWLQLRYKRQFLDLYLKTGKKDATVRIIQDMETQMAPYNKIEIADARLAMYLELDDIENAERTVEDVEKTIQKYKYEAWRDIALHAWGRIHEMKGEYKQAMENYQKELELKPTDWGINTDIGRCYKNVKDYKKAEKHIKKTLEILPFDPKAHYEIALVYADMDKKEKAVEHLKKALYVWEDADPDYQPAKKAREKLKELEATL